MSADTPRELVVQSVHCNGVIFDGADLSEVVEPMRGGARTRTRERRQGRLYLSLVLSCFRARHP
jgi:hypothetical protein